MRVFHCDHCGLLVFFENTSCGRCGHKLAYLPDVKLVASLDEAAGDAAARLWTSPVRRAAGRMYRLCANYADRGVCNWAVPADDLNPLCAACRLTHVVPNLSRAENLHAWRKLETAKRRLVYSLMELRLPVRTRTEDPEGGLEFRFLADLEGGPAVLT